MRDSFAPMMALIRRELLVQLRSKRSLAALSFLMAIAVLLMCANWPTTSDIVWSQLSTSSKEVFLVLSGLLLVGIAMFVPGLAAVSILGERVAGNWDSLSLTLIRPSSVVWAKLACVASLLLIFVVVLAPFFASIMFLVGFDWRQLLVMLVLIVCTVATTASIGLACSARFRTLTGALVMSYGAMLMLMGLPLLVFLAITLVTRSTSLGSLFEWSAPALSPFSILLIFGGGGVAFWYFYAHLAYQAVYFAGGLLLTWQGVRRAQEPAVPRDDKAGTRRRNARTSVDRGAIPDSRNPVFVREMRWGGVLKPRRAWIAVLLALPVFVTISLTAWALGSTMGPEFQNCMSLLLQGVMICTIVPALFANSFTKELEQRNADMLNMTLMPARTIVSGKFRAAYGFVLLIWLTGLVGDLPLALSNTDEPVWRLFWLMGHITILVGGVYAISLALLASVVAKRTVTALISALIMIGTAMVGLFVLLLFLANILNLGFNPDDTFGAVVFFLSPATAILRSVVVMPDNDLLVLYWAANVTFFSIVSCCIYAMSVWAFQRRRMQEG